MTAQLFNQENRHTFLNKVRNAENEKWMKTPDYKRAEEIRGLIQAEVDRWQGLHIPSHFLKSAEGFGLFTKRTCLVHLSKTSGGKVFPAHFGQHHAAEMTIEYTHFPMGESTNSTFRHMCLGCDEAVKKFVTGYVKDNLEDYKSERFNEEMQYLASEYYDVHNLMRCEVDKVVNAWRTIINKTRSVRAVLAKYPEAKDYMPEEMKKEIAPDLAVEEADKIIRSSKEG